MGKSNKANRTKGNTRPSSSEHSAHLLNQSGKSLTGFIGFESLEKYVPSYVPVTGQHSSDVADFSVDSDLRMVMRKMLKRDSVTRLKAVQEFGDLCSEKDKENVKNVLPFWPRLFNKLALDYDRRIREATHQANGKLIANVKREIAPYLKNIMGVWLLGQNDLHAPAASAAQTTFTETFPKTKQSEALMHCRQEVFSLFKDNLFEQTAKTLSDPSSTSAEDMENKYILVISATLQAMKLFLTTVSSNEISNLRDDYASIILNNKFWKFAKNKEPQIRGSWFALISFLCHVKPDIFAEMEKKLISAVFACLSESDPIVAPVVWESALHVVVNFDNCWQEININKVVLPQLWTLLNEAGRGNAHVVYPCILPFLSKFPREVLTKDTFLSQFFTSLKESLLLDCVKLSPMECDAILTTFMECLQYISFSILDCVKERSALMEKVLSDHVLPLVKISFYERKHNYLATSKFYSLLSSLVQKIENKCANEGEDVAKALSQTLILFWNNMYNIFYKIFEKKEAEKLRVSVYVTYFFHSIFTSSPVKSEKSKVRFDDEKTEEQPSEIPLESLPSINLYKKLPLTFLHIIKFIQILCTKTDESFNLCYLKILDELLACTLNTEFLKDVLKSYEESFDMSENTSLTFFNKIILKWISIKSLDASSVSCISDIIFSLCSSVSEEEALEILNICSKVKNPVFLENILSKGLAKYSIEPVIQNWVKNPTLLECILLGFEESMELLAKDETKNKDSITLSYTDTLLMCLTCKDLQESLNENKTIEQILLLCKQLIENGAISKNVAYIIEIGCRVIEAIILNYKDCWNYRVTDDLLFSLFRWKLTVMESGSYEYYDQTYKAISQALYSAILSSHKYSVITREDSFLLRASKELHSSICNLLTLNESRHIIGEILNLLHAVKDVQSNFPDNYSLSFVLSELLENIFPCGLEWQNLRENLVQSAIPSVLNQKFLLHSETENCLIPASDIYKLFFSTTVVSTILASEYQTFGTCEDEQYFEQCVVRFMPDLLWSVSYFNGDGYINKDAESAIRINRLNDQFEIILSYISYEKMKDILDELFYCSLSKGLYWALPFQFLIEKMKDLYPESITLFDDLISEVSLTESDYVSLNMQILSHHVSKEKKISYLANLLGDLIEKSQHSPPEINDEYLRKLAEICGFIQDSNVINEEIQCLLEQYLIAFPYDNCLPDSSLFYLEFISLMSSVVQHVPSIITKNAWDFLQNFLSFSLKKFEDHNVLTFLFEVALAYFTSFSLISTTEDMERSWTPSVSEQINERFLSLYTYVSGTFKELFPLPKASEVALSTLLKAIKCIPENVIFNFVMSPSVMSSEPHSRDDKIVTPLDDLYSFLLSDNTYVQLAAHVLLIKIMPRLSESLSSSACSECNFGEDEEEKVPPKLLPLVETLILLNELMEGMIGDIKIGECCSVEAKTEPYTFVSAYLFAWLQMLEFISTSPSQVRSGYVAHLEENKLLSSLFSNVFRLMPENPMSCFKKEPSCESPKKENLISLFLHAPQIDAGNPSYKQIQVIACNVFCTAVHKVPASVRIWCNNLDKNSSEIVNKFTSKYISGILCTEEIQAVYNSENLFKNMVVKARLGSREVIATYTVDDFTIELCVQLPANYPLGPITAERRGKLIIAQQEWKHWLMQLATVLNYQNGSILDGLNIWKKNLDKKFEGVEECMICYYILHNSTMKLPKLSCQTCKKKFHSACLYKWFHSINNTKCPLCREEFRIAC